MDVFERTNEVPRDIRNIIGQYVEGSRPLYREWANVLYYD